MIWVLLKLILMLSQALFAQYATMKAMNTMDYLEFTDYRFLIISMILKSVEVLGAFCWNGFPFYSTLYLLFCLLLQFRRSNLNAIATIVVLYSELCWGSSVIHRVVEVLNLEEHKQFLTNPTYFFSPRFRRIMENSFANMDEIRRRKVKPKKNKSLTEFTIEEQHFILASGAAAPECSICLESFKRNEKAMYHKCKKNSPKHVFHSKCIQNWIETKSNCPLCRFIIKM